MKKLIGLMGIVVAASFTQVQAAPKEFDMDSWIAFHQENAKKASKPFTEKNKKQKVEQFKGMDTDNNGTVTGKERSDYWKELKAKKK